MCSVINTKCKPNITHHFLQKDLGIIDLQCCDYGHLQSDLPSKNLNHPCNVTKKCCHVAIHVILGTYGLGTMCEVESPNFHALNG